MVINLPAYYEQDNSPGPRTPGTQWLPAAEASARHHYKELTHHEEQESTNPQASRNIRAILAVFVVLFVVWDNHTLPQKP